MVMQLCWLKFLGRLWDEMAAAIGAHHGLLQHSQWIYFGEEKKVESVDPLTSQGASTVMFHAMPCTDVVWDDDLLHGYEYQEQVVSTTAAMSRICANLDKQKMYGLSKCKKLQPRRESFHNLCLPCTCKAATFCTR